MLLRNPQLNICTVCLLFWILNSWATCHITICYMSYSLHIILRFATCYIRYMSFWFATCHIRNMSYYNTPHVMFATCHIMIRHMSYSIHLILWHALLLIRTVYIHSLIEMSSNIWQYTVSFDMNFWLHFPQKISIYIFSRKFLFSS